MTGYQGFQFQNLQSFEVEKALQNLNVRKSTGSDGLPPMALKRLMGSYFTDRYNRVKLGSVVSEWQRVTRGCPHGSTFGPLIWNIFQNDLTYTVDANVNMYADDHQFYAVGSTLSDVHDDLAVSAESASSWYRANLLKGNLDKYQTMAPGCGKESMDSIMIDNH